MKADHGGGRLAAIFSLVGCASMVPVSLLQTGAIRRVPDLALHGFDSQKVNLSRNAFPFGIPDGPLALLAFAANLPMIALAGRNRTAMKALKGKATVDALIAARYLYLMPAKEKAWCIYCLVAAFATFAVFAALVLGPLLSSRPSAARLSEPDG